MLIARRNFLRLGLAAIAAPAIVRASSLMPVKSWAGDSYYFGYDSIGNREDLADVIYNIMPTDTPFLRAISARGFIHEWQTDTLQ